MYSTTINGTTDTVRYLNSIQCCQSLARLVGQVIPKSLEVLELLFRGMENKEIYRELDTSFGTVKGYVTAILQRLGVRHRAFAQPLSICWLMRLAPVRTIAELIKSSIDNCDEFRGFG